MIGCAPAASCDVDSDAVPAITRPDPSAVDRSENVTVPVASVGLTNAVKVTIEPLLDGL